MSKRACKALLITLVLGSLPLAAASFATDGSHALYDFKGGLYNAGTAILHGHDPYQAGFLAHQAAIMRAGGIAVGETTRHLFSLPLYPAPANVAVVPLSLLALWLAGTLFSLLSVGALILGLRLLGVRDWRCFALALCSLPFVHGLYLGTIAPLLVLGAGVAWRWRAKLWPPALAIASIVVVKLFPWTLAVWLLVTRRWRTFALTVAIGVALMLAAWAAIGFAGMVHYPQMLANATYIQEGRAASLTAVLLAIGLPVASAQLAALAAGAALLGLAWRFARRGDGERQAFGLAVIAALTASPIVWDHYMVLLFVPVALSSRKLSLIWFVPVCTPAVMATLQALFPTSQSGGVSDPIATRSAVLWLLVQALVVVRLCWPRVTFDRLPRRGLAPGLSTQSVG